MRDISTLEATRHELIAFNTETKESLLICYSSRKSKREGMLCLSVRVGDIVPVQRIYLLAEATKTDPISWVSTDRKDKTIAVSGPWQVRWSGYTQRERRTLGELPSIYSEITEVAPTRITTG